MYRLLLSRTPPDTRHQHKSKHCKGRHPIPRPSYGGFFCWGEDGLQELQVFLNGKFHLQQGRAGITLKIVPLEFVALRIRQPAEEIAFGDALFLNLPAVQYNSLLTMWQFAKGRDNLFLMRSVTFLIARPFRVLTTSELRPSDDAISAGPLPSTKVIHRICRSSSPKRFIA
jgi:hypothetical protein